ncbi:MAG TPA: cupin domain-containing protein, partial [Albitalea sp.]|nr:cupin domain-containing protein [Albitalea sp.]
MPATQGSNADLPSGASRHRVWVDDGAAFSTSKVSTLRHNFHEHPLMQLPELARLAHRLMPSGQCRFIVPGTTQASEFLHHPETPDGRGIDEVFRRIEEPGAWIALYNVETDPQYRAFLADVQDAVKPLMKGEQPGIFNVGGFIFISAPPSVTPFHIDRENNFWLQMRGRKTMNVWDHTDREVVAAKEVEEFVLYGSLERVRLKDEFKPRSHEFNVGAGDGIYFPSTSPHMTRCDTDWVKPGDGVSVSIGTVFYSDVTRQHARVHQVNQVLRRLGMSPRAPGESAALDAFKAPFGHLLGA